MTEQTIAPHGGTLMDRLADETTKPHLREVARSLPQKRLALRELCDLELIAIGGYSPLDGFLAQRDYESVVDHMRLASGVVWSLPITLAATAEEAKQYHEGKDVALVNESGDVVALLHLHQKYSYDRTVEAAKVFRTTDPSHPGVAALLKQGDVLLGGPVTVLERSVPSAFPRYNLSPAQTRQAFVERAWRTVVGFQTRNPVHRAHEYIQKTA
ncbi:MAG: sulfate adenylyltransferase, partial [Chloroflexi bacterium]|nr:sulfate adenylyltransferase [Chloroflexota bacterium]